MTHCCSFTKYLIDLAGSEDVVRSKAEGQAAAEAAGINLSLSVLTRVVMALSESQGHEHSSYR